MALVGRQSMVKVRGVTAFGFTSKVDAQRAVAGYTAHYGFPPAQYKKNGRFYVVLPTRTERRFKCGNELLSDFRSSKVGSLSRSFDYKLKI